MIKLIKSTFLKEKETKTKLCAFIKKAEILSIGSECRLSGAKALCVCK